MNNLRKNIEKASGNNDEIEKEVENFASQYALWYMTQGQRYTNALSPDFDANLNTVKHFKEKVYGTKKWIKSITY